ncbi:hypothetical protein NHG22_10610 [Streptomyces sp. ATE26]|uniref:hypothetical protein n=1 Tax=Streptomyces sp. ATE26 TaxID=2954237 RepID=UPI002482C6B6|nr:hypothetical protein [Streptomyces sp. ATE26]MDI1454262.1 hypothetical protein [Streptomyces sp. ATE26]
MAPADRRRAAPAPAPRAHTRPGAAEGWAPALNPVTSTSLPLWVRQIEAALDLSAPDASARVRTPESALRDVLHRYWDYRYRYPAPPA